MKSWANKRLGDVLTFQRGFDITKNEQSEGTVPIVSSSGISSYHNKYKVSGPGVVTGRKGTLGKVHYILENHWPHDTTLWIKDFKGNLPRFIYYYLSIMRLENYDVGASNPTLNRNHLHKLKILWPLPHIQRKIAAILSAYDELIENNNRRIAILEKMAEEIYREWFVRLRFPGHEKVKVVKGVPEGWEVKKVEDLISRISVGKRYENKTVEPSGKVPVLDQGQSGIIGYHNDEPGVKASKERPIIVFANHTCYQRIIFHDFSAIQNVLPFKPSKELPSDIYWLHYATKDLIEFSEYKGHWPEFISKSLYYPGYELTRIFGDNIKPLIHNSIKLRQSNENLKSTRDLLLPRLISGKLDVEHLDIVFPPGMEEERS